MPADGRGVRDDDAVLRVRADHGEPRGGTDGGGPAGRLRDWRACDHRLSGPVSDGDVIVCHGCGQLVWVKALAGGFAVLYVTADRGVP